MSVLPASLLPDTAEIDAGGGLSVGGVAVVDLAERYGTPLFVYDEKHLRSRCREAVAAFPGGAAYATKAFLCVAMARLALEEGMDLDVATGGELHVALAAGADPDRLVMHGNNKSVDELARALEIGVGRIVVDSFDELDRIEALVAGGARPPRCLLRVNPGVEAHTHEYLSTGITDSKFGLGISSGDAQRALDRMRTSSAVDLVGIHAHIGSQVFASSSFGQAVGALAPFVNDTGVEELSIGGGLGVAYVEGETAPSITEWSGAVISACRDHGVTARVTAEPGRSIVARSALTLYTVGTIKQIPGVRTYVAVDGGMSDNPRPVLYGSGYEAFLPRATDVDRTEEVRIVGKHCESGDLIVSEATVPESMAVGDVLATPVTGAYGHSMGSNYNMVLRPPVVFVADGAARLVVRREEPADLLRRDVDSST